MQLNLHKYGLSVCTKNNKRVKLECSGLPDYTVNNGLQRKPWDQLNCFFYI